MKKIIALFALVAFLGITTVPVFAENYSSNLEIVDKEKEPKEAKSEKSEKKAECSAEKKAECTDKKKKAECGPK